MFPEINRFYFKVAVFTYKWSTFILCHAFLLLTLICFFRNFSLIFKRLLLAFDSDQLSQIFLLALFISHFIFVSETEHLLLICIWSMKTLFQKPWGFVSCLCFRISISLFSNHWMTDFPIVYICIMLVN